MKDFYDVYMLLNDNEFDSDILEEAIKATFNNRRTSYIESHSLFTPEFASDMLRKRRWTAFLKKISNDQELSFEEVMQLIIKKLMPLWKRLKE